MTPETKAWTSRKRESDWEGGRSGDERYLLPVVHQSEDGSHNRLTARRCREEVRALLNDRLKPESTSVRSQDQGIEHDDGTHSLGQRASPPYPSKPFPPASRLYIRLSERSDTLQPGITPSEIRAGHGSLRQPKHCKREDKNGGELACALPARSQSFHSPSRKSELHTSSLLRLLSSFNLVSTSSQLLRIPWRTVARRSPPPRCLSVELWWRSRVVRRS